jgi:capsular polysaccharide transport system permease protein
MNDPSLVSLPLAARMPALRARLKRWAKAHRGALVFVGLPTLLAALYYFVIAADLYASEARFIVRSAARAPLTGLAGFLQAPGGMGSSQSDVYSVHDFILSRDAVTALQGKLDVRAIFGRPEADFLAAYPNLIDRDNAEDFHHYYQSRVNVFYDTTTGLCTLIVKAFRPEDAQALAVQVLDEAEVLINRLNDRARGNAVRDAQEQVQAAEAAVEAAQQNMLAFRKREVLLDPGKASGAMFDTLAKMQAEVSAARARLAELDRNSPGSPLRTELESHIRALEQQVAAQRGRLAGGNASMAPKISEYDQLLLRQEFAAKELTSAMSSLETARADARRQQVYLDRVVNAGLPDRALYPRRVSSVLTVFVSCFLLYSIGALLLAGFREHAQD